MANEQVEQFIKEKSFCPDCKMNTCGCYTSNVMRNEDVISLVAMLTNPSPAEPSAAKDGVSLYPTDAELVEIGHKAKAAHPNDPEQMFYASMRMACDWSHARLKPFKYHVRFPDGEEEYFDGDDKERLAEVLQDDAAVNYINTPTVTPLYKRAAPAASYADDGVKCKTCRDEKKVLQHYREIDRAIAMPCPDCTPNTREEKQAKLTTFSVTFKGSRISQTVEAIHEDQAWHKYVKQFEQHEKPARRDYSIRACHKGDTGNA